MIDRKNNLSIKSSCSRRKTCLHAVKKTRYKESKKILYAIIHTKHDGKNCLERFSEEQWNTLDEKFRCDPEKVVYITDRIDDDKIKEFSEITWVRIDAPQDKKAKITVPFTPDDIPLMEENSRKEILAKKRKWDRISRILTVRKLDDSEPCEADESDVYAVVVMAHNGKKYVERFSKAKWEYIPLQVRNDTTKYPYYSSDITDKEFRGIEEIIWDRVYNAKLKMSAKIKVPFTPDDIPLMEENAVSEIQKRNEKWQMQIDEMNQRKAENSRQSFIEYQEHLEKVDRYFSDEMTDYDAIIQWTKLNYVMPAPSRILKIKKELDKSWEQFIDICREVR
ncbi:hypothetical protein [Treponema sp.]|uniref:hypothetical protein n=1 Tax=Treponema sp. TaxID=166 RepID=UPI0026002D59|nr:hypothetical protein [Treponema sp.]MBR4322804.1 hypothetical protein [Treponema sp.]